MIWKYKWMSLTSGGGGGLTYPYIQTKQNMHGTIMDMLLHSHNPADANTCVFFPHTVTESVKNISPIRCVSLFVMRTLHITKKIKCRFFLFLLKIMELIFRRSDWVPLPFWLQLLAHPNWFSIKNMLKHVQSCSFCIAYWMC